MLSHMPAPTEEQEQNKSLFSYCVFTRVFALVQNAAPLAEHRVSMTTDGGKDTLWFHGVESEPLKRRVLLHFCI